MGKAAATCRKPVEPTINKKRQPESYWLIWRSLSPSTACRGLRFQGGPKAHLKERRTSTSTNSLRLFFVAARRTGLGCVSHASLKTAAACVAVR